MFRKAVILACILAASAVHAADLSPGRWFPLSVGNKWEYSVREIGVMSFSDGEHSKSMQTESEGACVEEVLSVKDRRSDSGVVYEHRSATKMLDTETAETEESVMESLVLSAKDGVFILASKSSGMGGMLSDEWVNYNPPLTIYAVDMKAGKRWKVGTVREAKLRMPMTALVAGTESVSVPAGTFEDCLKIYVMCGTVSGTMGEGAEKTDIKSGKSVTTVWVAPGIGTVKEDSILQAKMDLAPDEQGRVVSMTGTQRKTKELQPGFVVK